MGQRHAGTVLRTTDDGTTWQTCTTPPNGEHLDLRGIQAFDADTAIVMSSGKGDLSRLYKTTDACKSWTSSSPTQTKKASGTPYFTSKIDEAFDVAFSSEIPWMATSDLFSALIGEGLEDPTEILRQLEWAAHHWRKARPRSPRAILFVENSR